MTIDVFIRVNCLRHIRAEMADLAIARWQLEPNVSLALIVAEGSALPDRLCAPTMHQLPRKSFWTASKQLAEDCSKSPIYVLADDDQLIVGRDWVKRGIACLEKHPDYGLLSAWSITGEVDAAAYSEGDSEVFRAQSSVGAPYFIRKKTIAKFPECTIDKQDAFMCKVLTDKGLKFGMMRRLRYNHLGAGYSTVSLPNWTGV